MKLYAYSTPGIPENDGYLKIGETTRTTHGRISQQGGQVNVKKVLVWEGAIATDRRGVDRLFRHFLRDVYGFTIQPNISGYGESEWVNCTVDDIKEAFPKFKEKFFLEQRAREAVTDIFYEEIRNWFYWVTQENKNIGDEYALRLVVRLLFCFFLREKDGLVPEELLHPDILKCLINDEEYSYYNGILRNLFFHCLNTPSKRKYENEKMLADKKSIKNWFSVIPFLNGGLFNEHDKDDVPIGNDYFFSGKKDRTLIKLGKESKVYGIITILSKYHYKLTLDNLLDQSEYGKTIDPEFIGNVFESLLSCIDADSQKTRQKITGSYYTPREIVDYMVNASLDAYLETKRQTDTKSSDTELLFQCKIFDPACGSGAFPCEAMNIILLRVEEDKKEKNNTVFSPSERYDTKLKIIRDVIYGVDIQPTAIHISQLRFFLSLIQEIKPDKREKNCGIDPLPNLEVKFVCADTLDGLPPKKFKDLPIVADTIAMLAETRKQYFQSTDTKEKKRLREYDEKLRNVLVSVYKDPHNATYYSNETAELVKDWNPYDQTKAATFFDPQWMFGISGGFDIVIGNPPYVDSETMVVSNLGKREIYSTRYKSTVGNWDLFVPFVENGIDLCTQHGAVSFIIPNKIISQDYAKTIRDIISNNQLLEIRDYSRQNVFPIADVYPVTILVKKNNDADSVVTMRTMQSVTQIERTNIVSNKIMKSYHWDIFFCTPALTAILVKIASNSCKFSDLVVFSSPCTVGEAYKIKDFLIDSNTATDCKKLINSGTIDQYVSRWGDKRTAYIKGRYLHPAITNESLASINNNRYEQSSKKKIIVANMTTALEAFLDSESEYLAGKSTVIGIGNYQNLQFITGLLNSNLISIWYQSVNHSTKMSGGALTVTADRLNAIPIPNVTTDEQMPIITLVNKIISLKKNASDADTSKLEQKIDALVYELYGLTDEEIAIVENH